MTGRNCDGDFQKDCDLVFDAACFDFQPRGNRLVDCNSTTRTYEMKEGIFQIPIGARCNITVGTVADSDGSESYNLTINATATAKIRYARGALRRLFVGTDIEFADGSREIWLSSSPEDDKENETEERVDQELVQQYDPAR